MTINTKLRLSSFRPGMTMIELLVAVSVLAILILIFGRILTQSQKVVTGSQDLMTFNANSTAAANTLKKDIQKINTGSGYFLYIVSDYVTVGSETWPRAKMYMGLPGSFTSWAATNGSGNLIEGTGAIIGVGLCNQNGVTTPVSAPRLFWRNRCIFTTDTSAPTTPQVNNDTWRNAYSVLETPTSGTKRDYLLNTWLNQIIGLTNWTPTNLSIPPATLTEAQTVWKYLMPNITKLSIMWTKGDYTTSDPKKLIWYGMDIEGRLHLPKGSTSSNTFAYGTIYNNKDANRKFDPSNASTTNDKYNDSNMPVYTSNTAKAGAVYSGATVTYPARFEFQHSYTTNGTTHDCYCALWNSELGPEYWPTAIKITYEVTDGKADNPTTKVYEIICPTGV